MKRDDVQPEWRQVRVFTRRIADAHWYAHFIGSVVNPLAEKFPTTPMFISRYIVGQGEDDADTDINELPGNFLFPIGEVLGHVSVRIGFQPAKDEEKTLTEILQAEDHLWYSNFINFGMPAGLAGGRFATNQDAAAQERRGELVANLLCANSRVIFDPVVYQDDQWNFETNDHELNQLTGTVAQSIIHIIKNPWSMRSSAPLPFYIRFNETSFTPL